MTKQTVVSASTLAVSLLAYCYARKAGRDTVPYVMVGGFVGALIGEVIIESKTLVR